MLIQHLPSARRVGTLSPIVPKEIQDPEGHDVGI